MYVTDNKPTIFYVKYNIFEWNVNFYGSIWSEWALIKVQCHQQTNIKHVKRSTEFRLNSCRQSIWQRDWCLAWVVGLAIWASSKTEDIYRFRGCKYLCMFLLTYRPLRIQDIYLYIKIYPQIYIYMYAYKYRWYLL